MAVSVKVLVTVTCAEHGCKARANVDAADITAARKELAGYRMRPWSTAVENGEVLDYCGVHTMEKAGTLPKPASETK